MIYQGKTITVQVLDSGVACLQFDLQGESVNKLNMQTSQEFGEALRAIEAGIENAGIRGLLITSGKSAFIVGADITEFGAVFEQGPDAVAAHLSANNNNFNRLEDLSVPTVAVIDGFALGGGLEVALACDYRLLSNRAKIGLPEVKLGLIPGWGGTVRLPRLAGLDTAVEWIASGQEQSAAEALAKGVADGLCEPQALEKSAFNLIERARSGDLDYQAARARKTSPMRHNDIESLLAYESSKMFVKAQAGRHYPAPVKAIEVMQRAAKSPREEAQKFETAAFVELAQTPQANALVGVFLADQYIGKKSRKWEKLAAKPIQKAAVLGAGIMGGGIAYQSAYRGVPIRMKDIAEEGLTLGLEEASKLLAKRVEKGRMTVGEMAQVLNRIAATVSYEGFEKVDIVVEAVVENFEVKAAVLRECEQRLNDQAILCTNTSTISIDALAGNLKKPENFCGMHFFNPVHAMPLVEVIRGSRTSDQTIAGTVAYANALGKKAIVVNDCPGFLVNRVLFPYFAGFSTLIKEGADFLAVDKTMERWGWPMGPAYLLDVVGVDTAVHAESVMAEGFPDRMAKTFKTPTDILFELGRLGQKSRAGFYQYEPDRRGKPQKLEEPEIKETFAQHFAPSKDFSEQEIIARMMVPMATELARCLEEKIVATPYEADMALVYGLGFPPFKGGLFRWLDTIGLSNFVEMAKPLEHLGELYQPTEGMLERAAANQKYYEF